MWLGKNRLHPFEMRPSRYLCWFHAHRYSIYAGSMHAPESATIRAACGERGAAGGSSALVLDRRLRVSHFDNQLVVPLVMQINDNRFLWIVYVRDQNSRPTAGQTPTHTREAAR
jgi:hypothetical protein